MPDPIPATPITDPAAGTPPATPAVPAEPEPVIEVTSEVLNKLRQDGNTEDLAAATKVLEDAANQPEQGLTEPPTPASDQPVTPVVPDPGVQQPGQPAAEKPAEVKQFVTDVRGTQISVPDPDNYLGYENFGRMKKGLVHAKQETEYQVGLTDDARTAAETAVRAQLEAENKVKEIQAKLDTFQSQPSPQPAAVLPALPVTPEPAPVVPPLAAVSEPIEKPVVPQRPKVSVSQIDWDDDDKAAMESYNDQMTDYNEKFVDYVSSMAAQKPAPQPAAIPQEVLDELKSTKDTLAEIKTSFDTQKQTNAVVEQQAKTDAYWDNIDTFRSKNKAEFGDPAETRKILKIHQDVTAWTDNLALALGGKKPFSLFDPHNPDWQNYELFKRNAVNQYLSDDPTVLQRVEGLEAAKPPAEYKEYYKVLDVINYSNTQKESNILGVASSLDDAYLHKMHTSGAIPAGIEASNVAAAGAGAQAAIDTLMDRQANAATNLPNDLQGGGGGRLQLSDDKKHEIMNMSPLALKAAGPEVIAQHTALTKELEAAAYGQSGPQHATS